MAHTPEQIADLAQWARGQWPSGDPGQLEVEPIAVDGSIRLFVRLRAGEQSLVAMANPDNPPENRAWLYLAEHLGALDLGVPKVVAADLQAGRFLMTDLGEQSLQQAVLQAGHDPEAVVDLYDPVLATVAKLQAKGAEGLDTGICFDGSCLEPAFLLEREAGYFMEQFVASALGIAQSELPRGLPDELAEICRRAGEASPQGLVHRDLQSRNLVIRGNQVGLVDFQGARLGPAQYDLASLVGDPYVDLDPALRSILIERYLKHREALGPFDAEAFMAGWPFVALSRAMQALGAYGFLTRVRGRAHFAAYIEPGLRTLRLIGAEEALRPFGAFGALLAMLNVPSNEMLGLEKE